MKFRNIANTTPASLVGAALFLAAVSGSQAATINAVLNSQDRIIGDVQAGGSVSPNYSSSPTNTILIVGTGGSSPNGFNNNSVVGFVLPTLLLGESIDSATFGIGVVVNGERGTMAVSLFGLLTDTPDVSMFYEGISGIGPTVDQLIVTDFSTVSGGAGTADTLTPSTSVPALTSFIQSFYSGGLVPSQPEVFFRLNPSTDLNPAALNRIIYTFNTASLSLNVVPEPSSAAVLGLAGMLLLVRRRRV